LGAQEDEYDEEYGAYKRFHGLADSDDDDESESESEDEDESESESSDEEDPAAALRARGALVEHHEDDEDELPWQVIALLDASILRDLRWSNAYREKRVALALAGEDVTPPLVDTIEGFLDAERALLLEDQEQGANSGGRALAASLAATPAAAAAGGAMGGGDGGVNGNADLGAAGWLYRVTAPEGVSLYKKPTATGGPAAGARPCGALLRVVEVGKGGWLRLAATEKGKLEAPLGVGDAVKVVSGQYAGTNGTVARGLDDKRELGVKLKGYTGTGTFHVTELKRDEKAAQAAAKKPKKDSSRGYDAYGRRGGYFDGSDSEEDDSEDEESEEEDSEDEEGAVSGGSGGAAGSVKEVGLWVCLLNESGGDGAPPPAQRSKHDKVDAHAASSVASAAGGARLEPVTSSTPLLVAVRSIEAQKLAAAPPADATGAAAAAAAQEAAEEESGTSSSTTAAPANNNGNSSKDANAKSAAAKAAESGGLVLEERDEAALFDRPFEPRLEAEDAANDDDDETAGADDDDASNTSEVSAKADAAATAAAALAAQVLSPQLSGAGAAAAAVAAGLAVGTRVVLKGLSAAHYNGREGVVLTSANAEGRQGVRLDPQVAPEASGPDALPPPPEKTLLLKMANLEPCDPQGASSDSGASSADGAVLARAAAVLGVSLSALGLPAGSSSTSNNSTSVAGHLEVLGAVLRATDRDLAGLNPSPPTTARAGVSEARRAHRVLAAALALLPPNSSQDSNDGLGNSRGSSGATVWQAELAPHAVVEQGFLGKRAAQAAIQASDPSSFTKIAAGVAALRQVLAEEQCRLVRHRGEWQANWGAQVPTWRMEQAESAAAAALMVDEVDGDLVGNSGVAAAQAAVASGGSDAGKALEDGCTGGSSGDCLLLRLCLVRSLLRARRDADALAEAAKAAKLHPCAAPALLWHGRCLLRLGQRDAGFKALSQAATLGANSSVSDYSSAGSSSSSSSGGRGANGLAPPGSRWASREALARVRALKRAKRAELKAKDAYERGKFAEAAQLYTQALAEYDGSDLNNGSGGGKSGVSGAAAAAAAAMGAGDGGASSVDSFGGDDKWGRAEALVARAGCLRRGRELSPAIADCDAALVVFPKYARALFRRALCLLESAKPTEALATLEKLLRVDRTWPRLLDWLIRASAQARRQAAQGHQGSSSGEYSHAEEDDPEGNGGSGSGNGGNADYYNVLGVPTDATEAQLKRAYRIKSLKAHPDKPGGSVTAFQLVATAYETLSDTEKRQLYDDGVDVKKKKKQKRHEDDSSESDSEDEDGNKKKSLREEVERKYFPENFKFWPFGDPFVEKRRHDARKAKEAEAKKQRKANPYAAPFRRNFGFGDY